MRKLYTFFVTLLGVLALFVWTAGVYAASYDVSASVPFPAPTQPAVIDPQLNGASTQNATFEIYGTCEDISPVAIVSIWRSGVSIGSVNCETNGTFRITISLISGANTLVARTSSISQAYGPDSLPITLTYVPPIQPNNPESPPATSSAGSRAQSTPTGPGTVNNGSVNDLTIHTKNTFEVIDNKNKVSIQVEVGGGTNPYTIYINWGDGVTESKTVAGPGIYTFEHTFEKQGSYKAVAKVTDVLGKTVEHQFAIVSSTPQPASKAANKPVNSSIGNLPFMSYFVPALITAGILGVAFVAFSSFWFGKHAALESSAQSKVKPKRKPSAKKRVSKK